jgi:outer membrane protein assembly factor BamB
MTSPERPRGLRWWPAIIGLSVGLIAAVVVRLVPEQTFQWRNTGTMLAVLVVGLWLVVWWLAFSRASWRLRLGGLLGVGVVMVGARFALRFRGMTGDFVPIVEPVWAARPTAPASTGAVPTSGASAPVPALKRAPGDFPQYLGPNRDVRATAPALATNWTAQPPAEIWRRNVGAAWSGFVIVGNRALTQEQDGSRELVTAYDLADGRRLWAHVHDDARYATAIAGEGPRCTPVVVGERVFTLGATGWLDCLDLATGTNLWSTNIMAAAKASVPVFGYAGTPWVADGRVFVSAGGTNGASMMAFDAKTGAQLWAAGSGAADYGSPFLTRLAGVPQVIIFNIQQIAAHDPATGAVLWERPWGARFPLVAIPIALPPDGLFVTAGYGVGALRLRFKPGGPTGGGIEEVWSSKRMKAKFSNPVERDGFVYALDDGMFACLDLKDGSQRWKAGRYGHGQGLLVTDLYVLMSEEGELVLLRPTPDAPNELARHRVFRAKTWNPIAIAGDVLLTRTDQEAVCLRLPLAQ